MTEGAFPQDAPWVSPELAADLVRRLATGRYDALAGRYLHAARTTWMNRSGGSTRCASAT